MTRVPWNAVHVPPERTQEMVRRYRAGESMSALARDYHLRRERVRAILAAAGIAPEFRYGGGVPRHVWPTEVVERAVAMYRAGDSVYTIARAIKRPPASTWNQLRRAGVEMRPPRQMSYTPQQALDLKRKGWLWRDIGAKFGITGACVRGVCTRAIIAGRARA